MHKILVVDDEDTVLDYFEQILEAHGFQAFLTDSPSQALKMVEKNKPDLVFIDIMLGNSENGFVLCEKLRALESQSWQTKIIMLSCLTESHYKASAYHSGADGYITKPVDANELIALVKAQLRISAGRTEKKAGETGESDSQWLIKCGFSIDLSKMQIWHDNKLISSLTPTEFQILVCLLKYHPGTVNRDIFAKEVWKGCLILEYHTISSSVHRLKKKLPRSASCKIIPESKQGYRIKD